MTGAMSANMVFALMSGVIGLLIGSFLNVVIYRVPNGMSIVRPRSSCPNCDSAIRTYDNVPVLSWIVLRGRCRDCSTPISGRYPVIELVTGVLFAIVAARFLPVDTVPSAASVTILVAFLYLMAISVALTMIDLDTHTLPNALVLPSYPVLVVLLGGASVLDGDWVALLRAVIGLAALGTAYLVLAIAVPGGMGFGDVKLAGVIGFVLAYLGWGPLAVGAFGAFLLGGIFAVVLVVTRRAGRRSGIPFGPWMVCGAWIGVFFGSAFWNAYLALIGLA